MSKENIIQTIEKEFLERNEFLARCWAVV